MSLDKTIITNQLIRSSLIMRDPLLSWINKSFHFYMIEYFFVNRQLVGCSSDRECRDSILVGWNLCPMKSTISSLQWNQSEWLIFDQAWKQWRELHLDLLQRSPYQIQGIAQRDFLSVWQANLLIKRIASLITWLTNNTKMKLLKCI